MQLRTYQEKQINAARVMLRALKEKLKADGEKRGPRILLQCPTGGGKTAISAFIVQSAVAMGNVPVYFMCHRDFLVDQTSQTYGRLSIDHSFIASGKWYNQWPSVHVGMVQSVRSRLAKLKTPKLVIWDEAHHIGAATWAAIMMEWPQATHIGLSATPIRLDGKGLDAWFDGLVPGPSPRWLIEQGYLSDYRAYAPSSPDLTALHTRMGDYVKDEVDELMDKSVIIGDMVRDYRQYAHGRKAVYFCTSVKHSQHVTASFNAAGYRWLHLDGNSQTWERRAAAQAMAKGELDGFCNVDLFGEGFDLAAQAGMDVTIECVGLARPTQSLGMYMQQVGRALRPKPDAAILLDHAGNISKHGLPDDDREWSLEGVKKKPVEIVYCQGCGAAAQFTTIVCKHCGEKLREVARRSAPMGAREVEQKDGDLHEIDKESVRKAKKLEEWQAGSVDELVDIARRRGYSNPDKWAAYIWTARKQRDDAKEYARKQQMDFFQKVAIERYAK